MNMGYETMKDMKPKHLYVFGLCQSRWQYITARSSRISWQNLFLTAWYFVSQKNLNSLNFADVIVSFFTGEIGKLSSSLLWVWTMNKHCIWGCLPKYLLVFMTTVSKFFIQNLYLIHLQCMMNCVACDHFCQLILKSLQSKFIFR